MSSHRKRGSRGRRKPRRNQRAQRRPVTQPVGGAYVRPGATDLGLPEKSVDEIIQLAAQVPAEWGFITLAGIAAGIFDIWTDTRAQFDLALRYFPGVAAKFIEFVALHEDQRPVLFSEQQLFIAQRLLIEHGKDGSPDAQVTEEEVEALAQLVLYATDIETFAAPIDDQKPASREEVIAYVLQSAHYSSRPHLVTALARTYDLLIRPDADNRDDRLPIDDWAVRDYALSLSDQFVGGYAVSVVLDAIAPKEGKTRLADDFFDLPSLADKKDALIAVLSATREEYRALFAKGPGDALDVAWEITPFLRKPLFRASDGKLYMTSPRCLVSWISEGFFHRLLASAQNESRETSNLFSSFYGKLLERYAVEMATSSLGKRGLTVSGDQPYDGGHTPDLMIRDGRNYIVAEIRSGSLSREFRTRGTVEALNDELAKTLFDKLDQFDRSFAAILRGEVTVEGFDFATARAIWPILVLPSMMITRPIYELAEEHFPDSFRDPRVRYPIITDFEGLELLIALGESRRLPKALMARDNSPYRFLDIDRWVLESLRLPSNLRPSLATETFEAAAEEIKTTIFPDGAPPVEDEAL